MKIANPSPTSASGFSLIEMLMTIAILGIMISIALPWYGKNGDEFRQARDQRNAQSICSLCEAAEAAGMNVTADARTSLDIARKVANGITIESGLLKGRTFCVPGLGQEELEGAARFLSLEDGELRYNITQGPEGGETNPS